jgi:hypothetical protein
MSPDGYVTITGRIKDLIIRGGENIHPLEIENCLFAHPRILNVSVVGVPDERYGEVVAAFVVPRDEGGNTITVQEIKDWVRDKLSHHLGKDLPTLFDESLVETFDSTGEHCYPSCSHSFAPVIFSHPFAACASSRDILFCVKNGVRWLASPRFDLRGLTCDCVVVSLQASNHVPHGRRVRMV